MRVIILSILLFTSTAHGIDNFARDTLMWNDTKKAQKYSDYAMYSMVILPYVHATFQNDTGKKYAQILGSQALVGLTTHLIKSTTKRTRPNGSNNKSFPSGHTSTSFVGAGYFCAYDSKLCIPAVLIASSVGYLRIGADKHWLSDVLVGAGLGFAGGRLVPTISLSF